MSHALQLRAIRAHFGLTQALLADWLQVNRAHLASVETGREQLPAHARFWLSPWLEALNLSEPADELTPAMAAHAPANLIGPAPLLDRLTECYCQAQRLSRQQADLLTRYRIQVRRLAAGPVLQAALPAPTRAEEQALGLRRRWLARLLEEATDALATEAAGPATAILLDVRRRAFLHEAACLEAYLAGEPLN